MGKVPKSRLTLSGELKDQRAQIRDKGTQFSGTGLHFPSPGVTQVEGNLWVTGDFTADGKISNDALTSPVFPDRARGSDTVFSVPFGSWNVAASQTVTVPTGFTTLVATVQGYADITNPNTTGGSNGAGGDFVYCYVSLGGQSSAAFGWPLSGSNGFTGTTAGDVFVLTGLTAGSTMTLAVNVSAAYQAMAAHAQNRAVVSAGLLWFR